MDELPNIEGALPPTIEKNPIDPIEPARCVGHLLDNVRQKLIPSKYVDSSIEDKIK